MQQLNDVLNTKFIIIFISIQILTLILTRLRAKRFKNLDINLIKNIKKISISEIQAYLSFVKWIGFLFPFKIGDMISLFILKKKLINYFSSTISYFLGSKFFEFLIVFIIAVIVCSIFFLETKFDTYNKIDIRLLYSLFLLFFIIIIFFIKKNKNNILKISFKNQYVNDAKLLINSKNFFTYTFFISIFQYISTVLLLFISSDAAIDNELFFLATSFILLNLLPLRLPLNVGLFDFIAILGNHAYDFGLSFDNLVFFRLIQLIIFSLDMIFWFIIYRYWIWKY